MKGATRVVVIGGGVSGLISSIEIVKAGACVDLVEKTDSVGGQSRAYDIDLNEESKAFLVECGIDVSQIKSDNVKEVICEELNKYLHTFHVSQVRVILNTEATSLLTDQEGLTALGVRFLRSTYGLDQKVHTTEGNTFGDAIVFAIGESNFHKISSDDLKEVKEGKIITKSGKPIADLYVSKDIATRSSLNAVIAEARKSGKESAQSKPRNLGLNKVRQPLAFTDKNGIVRGIALSPDEWRPLVLSNRFQLNKFNHLLRFSFPNHNDQAGIFCGQYIAIRAILDGQEIVRYYSPVSRNSDYGHIDLMIKIEEDLTNKPMARQIAELKVGDTIDFKGPMGGFEYHRNTYREIGMIAGGTGITPMVQIIRSIANHPEDDTKVTLLYGNFVEDDILCRDELCYYNTTRSNIKVYITLNNCPAKWSMGYGFINEEMMRKTLPAPAKDIVILLCGPPPMIKAMITMLKSLGYTDQMIFSFV